MSLSSLQTRPLPTVLTTMVHRASREHPAIKAPKTIYDLRFATQALRIASGQKIVWLNFAQWRMRSYRHRYPEARTYPFSVL